MFKYATIILVLLVSYACTIKSEIPYREISSGVIPKTEKYPYKATYVPMSTDKTYEKRISTGSGITADVLYLIPVQKHINQAAKTALAELFDEYTVSELPKADRGVVLSIDLVNFNPEVTANGLGNCSFVPSADIKLHVADKVGLEIYATASHYEASPITYSCFSNEEINAAWNKQTYMAVSGAIMTALKDMRNSYTVNNYVGQQPASAPAAVVEQNQPMIDGGASDKDKLRYLFEKSYITADQLKRAVDELSNSERSKLLDAFLSGKLEGKNFGELY